MDGRVGVVGAIVEEGFVGKEDSLGGGEDLEIKAKILIRRPGGGEKTEIIFKEEVTAVDGGPDGGRESEEFFVELRVARIVGPGGSERKIRVMIGDKSDFFIEWPIGFGGGGRFIVIPSCYICFMFFCKGIEGGKSVWFEPVVWFEDADVFTLGFFESLVHGVAIAGVWFIDDDNTRVFFSVGFNDV